MQAVRCDFKLCLHGIRALRGVRHNLSSDTNTRSQLLYLSTYGIIYFMTYVGGGLEAGAGFEVESRNCECVP